MGSLLSQAATMATDNYSEEKGQDLPSLNVAYFLSTRYCLAPKDLSFRRFRLLQIKRQAL